MSGWFGIGKALSQIKEDSKSWSTLSAAVTSWAPAKYIFTNIESGIYSADLEMMNLYASLCEDTKIRTNFMSLFEEEFIKTRELLTQLFDKEFAESRPKLHKTLELRDEPLRILHKTQVDLLSKWRAQESEEVRTQLLLATNAIAGGLKTTG